MKALVAIVPTLVLACTPGDEIDFVSSSLIGSSADPAPSVTFSQVAASVGLDRRNEPASAGTFTSTGTYPYGGWLADLNSDGLLDYYAVNHGQQPHLSGLFLNNGSGGFGQNLFTVS